jgi:hypothetical protein
MIDPSNARLGGYPRIRLFIDGTLIHARPCCSNVRDPGTAVPLAPRFHHLVAGPILHHSRGHAADPRTPGKGTRRNGNPDLALNP